MNTIIDEDRDMRTPGPVAARGHISLAEETAPCAFCNHAVNRHGVHLATGTTEHLFTRPSDFIAPPPGDIPTPAAGHQTKTVPALTVAPRLTPLRVE